MSVNSILFNSSKYIMASSGNYKLIAIGGNGITFADGSTLYQNAPIVAYAIYHPEGDKYNNHKKYYDLKHLVNSAESFTSDQCEKLSDEALAKTSVKVYFDNAIEIS